jgi:hypothetical protein
MDRTLSGGGSGHYFSQASWTTEVLRRFKAALSELPTRRELIPTFVDATMVVAASNGNPHLERV